MAGNPRELGTESRGIHLVDPEKTSAPPTAGRIEIGEYYADVLVDRRSEPEVVHWIVQRRGAPEILQWGHEDRYDDARRQAITWIESQIRYDEYRNQMNR